MSEPVLRVKNLRKEFGGLIAVKDVSFEVGPGEFIGLIGPNGCGKSTTFNCISGLLDQTAGSIEIFGKDASNMRPDQIQNLGFTRTFQHTRLWRQMTVIENLLVPPREQFKPNPLASISSLVVNPLPHSLAIVLKGALDIPAIGASRAKPSTFIFPILIIKNQ